jgi:hypothetical protein
MFVGYNSDQHLDLKNMDLERYNDVLISSLPRKLIDDSKIDLASYTIFTDNYSPTDYFTALGFKRIPEQYISR